MATQTLTWPEAVDRICDEMERFDVCRANGFELAQAAVAVGISLATALRYQRAIDRLLADLKNDEAAPGPARPETAETGAPNPLKGAIAP